MVHVVGIHGLGRADARRASALARLTGTTTREAGGRVASAGPRVVATYSEEAAACGCAAALRSEGLSAFVVGDHEIERDAARVQARDFQFRGDRLWVRPRRGAEREVAFRAVELLLRIDGDLGTRRPAHGPGKPTPQLLLYSHGRPTIAFRADEVWYQSLGAALRPGRMANFAQLVAELRRRCVTAKYDARLADRVTQARILGPLRPEVGLDVAASIVARGYRTRAPYRSDRPR